jgi:hypothetical protein
MLLKNLPYADLRDAAKYEVENRGLKANITVNLSNSSTKLSMDNEKFRMEDDLMDGSFWLKSECMQQRAQRLNTHERTPDKYAAMMTKYEIQHHGEFSPHRRA